MSNLSRTLLAQGIQSRPHFAFPFERIESGPRAGKVATVEQDTTEHIMSCENVIASCPRGFRVEQPEFGIPWPEYTTNLDEAAVLDALRRQEPRARLSGRHIGDAGDTTIEIDVEA